MLQVIAVGLLVCVHSIEARAQGKFGPEDPIASINGEPVFLGELNLVLMDRLRIRDLDKAPQNVQQATAALIVRQHLALISLRQLGGESLSAMINRQISEFAAESQRRGSSLEKYAKERKSDARSFKNNLAFQIAWRQYLKSQLTESNLRRFYAQNQHRYAGGRWNVSQLFLELDVKDETSVAVVGQRMSNLIETIRQSDSPEIAFADAAREHSDAQSAGDGGRVGWVEQDGDLPSSVMKVVRAQKSGTVSDPIRSPLGLHTVFVHQFEGKDVKFDDLTDQAQLRRDATDRLFHRLVRQQKDAKIQWYISGLKPPAGVNVIPNE